MWRMVAAVLIGYFIFAGYALTEVVPHGVHSTNESILRWIACFPFGFLWPNTLAFVLLNGLAVSLAISGSLAILVRQTGSRSQGSS